jgi:hypothetical protein
MRKSFENAGEYLREDSGALGLLTTSVSPLLENLDNI